MFVKISICKHPLEYKTLTWNRQVHNYIILKLTAVYEKYVASP